MTFLLVYAAMALASDKVVAADQVVASGEQTISGVIKLLQQMLVKSKKEGEEEAGIYEKFHCYCEHEGGLRKQAVKDETQQIALLSSKMEITLGKSGKLSIEIADLTSMLAANTESQKQMTAMRTKEKKNFDAKAADLKAGASQMDGAIKELSKAGNDQKFLPATGKDAAGRGGLDLLSRDTVVSKALAMANAYMKAPPGRASGSGQVLGVLKSMSDTFKADLKRAATTEAAAKAAHESLLAIKTDGEDRMAESMAEKKKALSNNDDILGTTRFELKHAKDFATDLAAKDQLEKTCAAKSASFENRKMHRANEETAIAECVKVLDSDEAFATFNRPKASALAKEERKASSLNFIQLSAVRSIHRHDMLSATAVHQHTHANGPAPVNPFQTVLDEIDEMIKVSQLEQVADDAKIADCSSAKTANLAKLESAEGQIDGHEGNIAGLNTVLTGLRAKIQATEEELAEIVDTRYASTASRKSENLVYQEEVKNSVQSSTLLSKAIGVLTTYYNDLKKEMEGSQAASFVEYKGQGGDAKKGSAITMLEYIKKETDKEQTALHKNEEVSQHAFEDDMKVEKDRETTAQAYLVAAQKQLGENQLTLSKDQKGKRLTEAEKASVQDLMAKSKAGCEYVSNPDRKAARDKEVEGLQSAKKSIEGTDAFVATKTLLKSKRK